MLKNQNIPIWTDFGIKNEILYASSSSSSARSQSQLVYTTNVTVTTTMKLYVLSLTIKKLEVFFQFQYS